MRYLQSLCIHEHVNKTRAVLSAEKTTSGDTIKSDDRLEKSYATYLFTFVSREKKVISISTM